MTRQPGEAISLVPLPDATRAFRSDSDREPTSRQSPGAVPAASLKAGQDGIERPVLRLAVRHEVARMSEHARSEVRRMS